MADPLRVLYVDDEPGLLEIGKLFLEQSGDFTVTTALSAPEALRVLEQEKFDAIISDYMMPDMDGIQFLVEVRTRFGPIPFILFTGRGREEVVIQAINKGADFYLQKGGNPQAQFAELIHKVRQAASRKRADDALRNSEEQHRTILQTTLDGIWMVDAGGKITDVNETYCRMSGYTRAELLKLHVTDLDAVEKPAETAAHIQRVIENGSGLFESSHRRKDGSIFDVEVSTTHLNADGGKFICFCRDITERKRAELERVSAQERLKEAHRLAHIGTWDWVMETDIVTWSEELCNIAGWDPSLPAPMYAEFPHIYTPSSWELLSEAVTRALTTGEPYNLELEMIRQDGSIRWTNAFGGMNRDGEGKVIGLHGTVQDITGRKKAEEALRTSEEKFRKAFFTSPNSICITRLSDGLFVSINKGFTEITGYTEEDVAGKTSLEINIWKDPEDRRKIVEGLKAHGEVRNYEARFLTKTGEIYGSMSTSIIELNGVPHILNITHDLSERKKAEEALMKNTEDLHSAYEELTSSDEELRRNVNDLAKSEQSLRALNAYNRSLLEAGLDSLVIINPDGKIADVNTSTEKITGYSREELIGTDFSYYFTEPEQAKEGYQRTFADGTVRNYPLNIRNRDGHITPVLYSATVYRDENGKVSGVFAAARDITERKRAEEAHRQSEKKFRLIAETIDEAFWMADVEIGKIFYVSPSFERIWGLSRECLYNNPRSFLDAIHKEDRERVLVDLEIEKTGQPFDHEYRIVLPDGNIRNIWDRGFPIRDETGQISTYVGIAIDITERKRAEAAVTESFAIFKTVMDSLDALVYVSDMKTHEILFINKYGKEIFGDITGKICWKSIQVDQNGPCPFCTNEKLLDTNGNPAGIIVWEFKNTINEHWYECHDSAIRWTNGRIVRIEIASDITERKRAEEALVESESFNRGLVENLPDYIAVYGMDGKLLYVNPASARTLGYDAETLIGTHVLSYIAEKYQETIITKMTALKEGDEASPYEIELVTRNGSRRSVIVKATPVQYQNNPAVLLLLIDITERKVAEEALQQANRKLTLLSGITRHDMLNQLTVLKGNLELLERKPPDPLFTTYFNKISRSADRIHAMIQFTREYEEIGVHAPKWQDCQTLVDTAARQAPLGKVMVKNDLPAGTEVFADPLVVRVFYNLMDNAVRYGGEITTLRFSVEETGDDLLVVCEDNGIGVPAEEKEKIFERGCGKNTGLGLALSRVVLEITGITIRETGEPGKGARFEMTVPKGAWRIAGE